VRPPETGSKPADWQLWTRVSPGGRGWRTTRGAAAWRRHNHDGAAADLSDRRGRADRRGELRGRSLSGALARGAGALAASGYAEDSDHYCDRPPDDSGRGRASNFTLARRVVEVEASISRFNLCHTPT